MPGKGRAPTPTRVLKLKNSKRAKYNRHDDEPEPTLGVPPCPKWLDKEATAEWRRVAPELSRMGVLAQIERGALAGYCQSWSMFRACCEQIAKEGEGHTVTTDKGNVVINPEVKIMEASKLAMLRFAQDLGLTPASRTRVHAKPAAAPKTGAAKFFPGKAAG